MSKSLRVLVTDAGNRVALAVVRALGQAGIEVVAVEQERFAAKTPPAFLSRHVSRHHVVPSLQSEKAFFQALPKDVDVVLPISTNVLLTLAKHKIAARMPIPPIETIRRANDKSAVLAVAKRAGVPVPASFAPEAHDEAEDVAAHLRYPAIVKLRTDEGTYLDPSARYRIVEDAPSLIDAWDALHRVKSFPVIQEFIPGDGYGVGLLARDGETLAAFCHRRVREFPVSGGPSALCESVVDETLAGYGRAMMRELRWTGVAMAEFKKDERDGAYRLLEVNPRFWGSLPLALKCGINFPHLLCRMAMGEKIEPVTTYEAGVRLRFLAMDIGAAFGALGDPGRRARYVYGFLKDLFDTRVSDGIFDASDLRASVAYVLNHLP